MINEDELFDLRALRGARRYQAWVVESLEIPKATNVIEVGAGVGNITHLLSDRAGRVTAVEPELNLAAELEALSLPNVEVVQSRIETLPLDDLYDVAVLVNVLEHIDDDLEALRHVRRVLEQRGQISVLVPAHQVLYGSLDSKYAHLRRYSLHGVVRLLR